MKRNFLISMKISENEELIINPIIDPFTLLEKVERKIVYSPKRRRYFEVVPRIFVFPVYLPEIGGLLSLEMISKELAKKFYNEVKDFDGLISKGKIFTSVIHNFRSELNRMVSWGNIRPFNLSKDHFQLYLTNLINDFVITPSIVTRRGVISPNRWFRIGSEGFQATLHYNIGVVYLQRDFLLERKEKTVWINSPFNLYEVKAGFVIFQPNGYLKYIEPVPLHFTSDPAEEDIIISSGKGDYFLCFLITFNQYFTSHEKSDIKSGFINIVEVLSDLVFSPYDILPFLFPLAIDTEKLSSLLFKFQVKKSSFFSFLRRLEKFSSPQAPQVVEFYESLIKERNKALKIIETEDTYIVKIINPILIPFILKKLYDPSIGKLQKNSIERLLRSSELMNELEELSNLSSQSSKFSSPEFSYLWGIGPYLRLRKNLMGKYVETFRKFYKIRKFQSNSITL